MYEIFIYEFGSLGSLKLKSNDCSDRIPMGFSQIVRYEELHSLFPEHELPCGDRFDK